MVNETKRVAMEDAALDRVLARTRPKPDAARETALLDRIMLAVERTPRIAAVNTATPSEPTPVVTLKPRPQSVQQMQRNNRDWWGAAGILAASLVIGVMAGQSSITQQTVRHIEETTGLTLATASYDLARTLAAADSGEDDSSDHH